MHLPNVIRRIADPLLERIRVPIVGGPNRGLWWNLASAGRGHMSGRREALRIRCIASLMRPGDVVWDVGAHKGYVTLCAARRVGPTGSVHAFEPSEHNRQVLSRHVRWNGLTNVSIHPFALSSYIGTATFGGTGASVSRRLGGGTDQVEVRTADSLVASGAIPAPTLMKIDVEGAEAGLLQGAGTLLRGNTRLMMAIHARDLFDQCETILREAGNSVLESRGVSERKNAVWLGDPDLYATGPGHADFSRDAEALRAAGF